MKETKKRASKSPTLSQIAKSAGVSKATASMALNNSPLIAKETRRRVLKIAQEKNYRPNFFARRLSKGQTESITLFCIVDDRESSGWVLPSTWNYYNPILKSAYFTLMENNYQLQFEIITYEEAVNKNIILNKTLDGSTDGLLLLITSKNNYAFLDELSDFPIVTLNATVSSSFCSVKVNDQLGVYEAVNYLLSLGHRDIAHIKGPTDHFNVAARHEGYLKALQKAGINPSPDYIKEGDWRIDSGERIMSELLELETPPSAVFCCNDHMAIGALKAIKNKGLRVPEDISVIGYDDSEIAKVAIPELTSIQPPLEELGRIGANEILQLIKGKNVQTHHVVVSPKLIMRSSCGPCARH